MQQAQAQEPSQPQKFIISSEVISNWANGRQPQASRVGKTSDKDSPQTGLIESSLPTYGEDSKLHGILSQIDKIEKLQQFLDAGFNDLWLPLPMRVLRKLLADDDSKAFWDTQEKYLDDEKLHPLTGQHYSLFDAESIALEEIELLGAVGYGEVHRVKDPMTGTEYARKTMARPVAYKQHCDLLKNFKREVNGMRRVFNSHCVNLMASYTSMDSVILLSSPVADIDLSGFLNLDLNARQMITLRHAVGCITSALTYLHSVNIRHDDLKPNNILVHGNNILLTDFGFCLDFSDSGMSTTAGPPAHFTQRYSAPEVFDREPRSRLTDVWGLGCVLFEIVSRIRGYKLDYMKAFWCSTGIQYDSYAQNRDATMEWYRMIVDKEKDLTQHGSDRKELLLLSFIYHVLLEPSRLHRPNCSQVLQRLSDMDFIYSIDRKTDWLTKCCAGDELQGDRDAIINSSDTSFSYSTRGYTSVNTFRDLPQWPLLDLLTLDSRLAYLLLDLDLNIISFSSNLLFIANESEAGSQKLEHIFTEDEVERIKLDVMEVMQHIPNPDSTLNDMREKVDIEALDIMKAVYLSPLQDTAFKVHLFRDHFRFRLVPKFLTVQVSFLRTCLERQSGYNKPCLVIVFDKDGYPAITENGLHNGRSSETWIDRPAPSHASLATRMRHLLWQQEMKERRNSHWQIANSCDDAGFYLS